MTNQQKLIVGLGNPGRKYEMTRHNVGFMVAEAFAEQFGAVFKIESRFLGTAAKCTVRELKVHLLMPNTYMNESGRAAAKYCVYYKIAPKDVIIISDDVTLDFGRLRLREKGSPGGHNGLKSIQSYLGTQIYSRLRVGIGNEPGWNMSDYVLGKFTRSEVDVLAELIPKSVNVLDRWLDGDICEVIAFANSRQSEQLKKKPTKPKDSDLLIQNSEKKSGPELGSGT